ncbi:Predicted arabinose efflux permease, MFS family [Sporobacter termitidis DSM 10068]|uniref:Predicted arabinose efflux permease, MFS family n=1 Tax=Sporobacter termitidis DSM 10068 TaxID=1123282 RepID=A0A1M5TYE2_9FIRM|nr:MFS transporter [Sporobacter termitidis]SHH55759.1 Predicted arabinose efflux permease, MFS family [Sporobacter termitidis DSM 10068]
MHGAAFGVVHSALSTVVVDLIPPDRRGEGIGFFSLNFTVATALGPLAGMFIVQHFTYTALFAVCAAAALLSLLLAAFVKIEKPVFSEEQLVQLKKKPLGDIFERRALPLSLVVIFMSLCYTGVTAFLSSYTVQLHQASTASLFFIVYAAAILICRPLAGKLLDKRGDNIVMYPAVVFYALSLLALAFARGGTMFILAAVLMALGYGNILNMGQTIAVKSVDRHKVGSATSTYFVFSDIGLGLGPVLLGLIAGAGGFAAMYLAEAAVVALGVPLYGLLHGRRARRAQAGISQTENSPEH